ncbi:MAG TPA: hypothetical protein VIL35_06200 [Vicinamibacterales bacterium]
MQTSSGRWARGTRIALTIVSIVVIQTGVCGLAALPVLVAASHLIAAIESVTLGAVVAAVILVPAYAVFALGLMMWSALASRLLGLRTPENAQLPIAAMSWDLMRWVQYVVAMHVVRVLAGFLYRGSPIWSWYLRLNGARVGRGVYVNSVFLSDHNLLELGDGVVIGADVHLSGHTVERGILKTSRVRIAAGATIGVGSVVEIGAEIGPRCQIGALSFVPKFATLPGDSVYAGIPVRRLDRPAKEDAGASRARAEAAVPGA